MAKTRKKKVARTTSKIDLSSNEFRAVLTYMERGLGVKPDDTMENPLYRAAVRAIKKFGGAVRGERR